ncbi:UNVERIFIED_CONTAM: H(+)-transporting V1 sector ATPase subunit G [Siphonaria sp. JEL0065]|nr:H(+)-transporting V1 sector ATPase subunit G [Siphonaria sp. JEL0065]
MAQNSQGIQTLLEAEKDASKIVTKARQYRVQRLKDARAEAQKEIEVLKAEKNKEFSGLEQKYSGSNDDSFAKVNAETDKKIIEIDAAYKQNKDQVIDRILASLVNVEPKVHINTRSA